MNVGPPLALYRRNSLLVRGSVYGDLQANPRDMIVQETSRISRRSAQRVVIWSNEPCWNRSVRVKPLEAGLDRGLFDDFIDDGEEGFLDCW